MFLGLISSYIPNKKNTATIFQISLPNWISTETSLIKFGSEICPPFFWVGGFGGGGQKILLGGENLLRGTGRGYPISWEILWSSPLRNFFPHCFPELVQVWEYVRISSQSLLIDKFTLYRGFLGQRVQNLASSELMMTEPENKIVTEVILKLIFSSSLRW